jgi:hypothetical protein
MKKKFGKRKLTTVDADFLFLYCSILLKLNAVFNYFFNEKFLLIINEFNKVAAFMIDESYLYKSLKNLLFNTLQNNTARQYKHICKLY